MRKVLVLFILLILPAAGFSKVEIEGVNFEQQRKVVDTELQLTGTALLTWAVFFDVYVGAFYLPEGQATSRWEEDVPKLLEISYLRNFKADDFSSSSDELLRNNLQPSKYQALAERLDRFYQFFRDISPGDRYSLVYHPGIGTELRLNGERLGSVAGHDFAVAYFGLWIGPSPISESFRDRILGG
ncbi:Chalcone isomerase-like [Malonomonas rubra DSM 5091]|uniref:Chalcone isomerase-like n=1 Tax=Malonomonas rubra DSM 5091 TaxID=1122189 RepID=A0A1M6G2E2_MALRU|nr:chalcone isomerase family protein [Malonomonas rubra]SHJ04090.1 Chalcone isomerase-like [Malonomonas rubra DSM 5091]